MPLFFSLLSYKRSRVHILPFLCLLLLISCGSPKRLLQKKQQSLKSLLEQSSVFQQGFTGFMLYDPELKQSIYEQQANRFFTPASNTKILTLYLCAEVLGDSIPALRYHSQGDSLFFWGTGDPSLLNSNFQNNQRVIQFLKQRPEKEFFFSSHNFQDQHFGDGWAWDDYYYDYQVEKSAMPIYGNVVQFSKKANQNNYTVHPSYFANLLQHQADFPGKGAKIIRERHRNLFHFHQQNAKHQTYQKAIPFRYSDQLFINLLQKELPQKVALSPYENMPPANSQTLRSIPSWKAYQQMMQPSDNFVGEQLLLLCAQQLSDTMNVKKAIQYAQKHVFKGLSSTPRWRDGSGLSRYNLVSPRAVVEILDRLYRKIPSQQLWQIFPAGGQSGTIQDWYAGGDGQVYVYAKTGSLSYVHCLSGYLITSSGRTLIFSFMHNNFPGSSRPYKQEMEKVLRQIYLDF